MNARKRPAPDPLLPLRSSKVQRTRQQHPLGGNATPSQTMGLLARWAGFVESGALLAKDTFNYFFGGGALSSDSECPQPPTPPPEEPPLRPCSRHNDALPPPRLFSNLPPPPPPPPPAARDRPRDHPAFVPQPLLPAPSRSSTFRERTELVPQKTGLLSPPTTHSTLSSSESSGSFIGSGTYPDLDAALEKVQRVQEDTKPVKRYRERPHIYDKQHKDESRIEWKKTLDEMELELFDFWKKNGYQSTLEDFRSLISYTVQLQDTEAALSPSRSFSDLQQRVRVAKLNHLRRRTLHEDFLKRALQKAQATINAPRPPRPQLDRLDKIESRNKEQNGAIDRRLRPYPSSLPDNDEAEVKNFLHKRGTTWKCAREQVSDQDLSRLGPTQWLNDEIINFYGAMIMQRAEASKENIGRVGGKKFLRVHYFSSFFWSKLKTAGYEKGRLAKWTKSVDIFDKNMILIPVNHNNAHWTAAAINFDRKRIESYDSMGMDRSSVYKLLREYLNSEHLNKKKKPFNFEGWTDYESEDTPQQENGYDCGVFTCQFLETLSRGEQSFSFTQTHMPYLRRRMVWEICHGHLREDT